jgi:hypothetical protein
LGQAAVLDLVDIEERTTFGTMLRTLGTVEIGSLIPADRIVAEPQREPVTENDELESPVKRLLDLQSENATVVRNALAGRESLDPLLIAPAIRLLARDDISEDAVRALRNVVNGSVGQLTDALLNADEDFAVRRRIPRVLAYCTSARAVDGLMHGLADSRFEVRLSCGRGLSRICSNQPALRPIAGSVYFAAQQEIANAKRLSEMPKVLDQYEDQADKQWRSADIRIEHIFRLLSLCLPSEPLHVAFQALHTEDVYLRGTALEYLESILPSGVRESLLHFLEGSPRPVTNRRPAGRIAEELMQSRQLIELKVSLAASRKA